MYKVVRASEGIIRKIADNKTANNITKEMRGTFKAITVNQPAFGANEEQ